MWRAQHQYNGSPVHFHQGSSEVSRGSAVQCRGLWFPQRFRGCRATDHVCWPRQGSDWCKLNPKATSLMLLRQIRGLLCQLMLIG